MSRVLCLLALVGSCSFFGYAWLLSSLPWFDRPSFTLRLGELVESSEDAFCSRVHTVWREMTPPNDAFTIYNEKRARRFPDFFLESSVLSRYFSLRFEVC